ncbi:MAG: TIGR03087 family PEP-CTERM/XrtA system glycosyltransferase [Rubrivivax sp.]
MARLLYLVHRLPYPPNKGDKVRSFHLLKHLAAQHEVHVGTFVDDPDDAQHLPALRAQCAGLMAVPLHPRRAKLLSLQGLLTGQALSLHYYDDARLHQWVAQTLAQARFDAIVVFSSTMAQYAQRHPAVPMLIDFVDVDSAKWSDYAPQHRWPLSWLYAREGRKLLEYERAMALAARHSFFATDKEAALFHRLAPESMARVQGMNNGVNAEFFSPNAGLPQPFETTETPLVFTGAMDYWPNIDAVQWFVAEVLPRVRQRWPGARLHIVGRSPAPAVRALASDAVVVTGTVPDVRPYLQHAAAVVAPLRLARGVQNKILEAMAMAKPVVAASTCVEALEVVPDQELLSATEPEDYLRQITAVLSSAERAEQVGVAARRRVLASYAWSAHLRHIDPHIPGVSAAATSENALSKER